MKKNLLLTVCMALFYCSADAQGVTQINANKSLKVLAQLFNNQTYLFNKTLLYSQLDSSIWVTDATLASTVQLSPDIKFNDAWGLLNDKVIFSGTTAATGAEVYVTDGTPGGTFLVSDITAGVTGSKPGEFVLMGSFLYFTAETPLQGRELWRTNGTPAGTTLVKDIEPGPVSSNTENNYHLVSNDNSPYLLFAANTTAAGNELWKSDGTSAGTTLLKDINTGNSGADSSNPDNFMVFYNFVLFTATDATHGNEIWRTDGTPAGTVLLKDINPGTASSTQVEIVPGYFADFFIGFHIFNKRAYFIANDGTSSGEMWVTDGNSGNTALVKDFPSASPNFSRPILIDAVNLYGKFIFPYGDGTSRSELWQSDGTPAGTSLLKSFSPTKPGASPVIFIPYSVSFRQYYSYYIPQILPTYLSPGDKFFFAAGTSAQGTELWSSDGTVAGTNIVKDVYPGTGNGIDFEVGDGSYMYTESAFFFGASDGTHGNELWQTDGTSANTTLVKDINPNAGDANPQLTFFIVNGGKVMFGATDGTPSDPTITDLYVVNGTFTALPVTLLDFTVAPKENDALLAWTTQQELNSKNFIIQRSYDGQHFDNIGNVNAEGTTYSVSKYSFTDEGIMNSGKPVVYYRLNAVDIDGKSALTNIISLKINGSSQWGVRLLSNPVKDFVSLLLSNVSGKLQLSIRDISGKIIYSKSMENTNGQITLPVPLQSGIYLLEADNNNERKIIKFVK